MSECVCVCVCILTLVIWHAMRMLSYVACLALPYFSTLSHWLCMVLKLGRFGQQIRNTWKVLKCGAREGWKRSAGLIM